MLNCELWTTLGMVGTWEVTGDVMSVGRKQGHVDD